MPTVAAENAVTDMKVLRRARVVRGWGQREFAEHAGLSPHRLWRLENFHGKPTLDEIQRLWTALTSGD